MDPQVPGKEGDVDDEGEEEGKCEVENPAGQIRMSGELLLSEIMSNMPGECEVAHLYSRNKFYRWVISFDKI